MPKALDAVSECAKQAGKPLYKVGLEMGKSKNYMSQNVSRNSTPKADTLARMLDVCGFALCAVPREQIPDGAMVITYEE